MNLKIGALYSVDLSDELHAAMYYMFHGAPRSNEVVTIHKIEFDDSTSIIWYTSLLTGEMDCMIADLFMDTFKEIQ